MDNLTEIHPEIFANLTSLEWLSLSGNKLTEIDPITFSSFDSLWYLSLEGNNLAVIQQKLNLNEEAKINYNYLIKFEKNIIV